ncbi:selina-4(15),7(11)-diene synthase [Actinomadura rubrisoli]|uniref:Terpene synthase n=1 Tax=Actinomadura rubrisoli TaxID=2530368 RepID=A0A4R5C936_9ACTN|nr:selina-4(15),7(11)-diene synthase [Actinomadura rubrisoli]TDD95156.1 terpene synthase [Actinomadura rubrisoli]
MSGAGIVVPPLYSPFCSAIHPAHTAIDASTREWAEAFGIGNVRLVDHDIGTFAARILPEGDRDVVQLLGDFVVWLFGVDDGYCEEGDLGREPGELAGQLSRLLRVAQNPEAPLLPGDPLAEGLRDLRRRLDAHASPTQRARWIDALREYFLAVVWEAQHRVHATIPSLADYTLMRLYDGATTAVPPLLEAGHGYELPADVRDSRPVRALAEMTYFIIAWDNDILSFHKEQRAGHYCLNAVRVLAHESGVPHDEALVTAVAQRDRVSCQFLRLRDMLSAEATGDLRQYLAGLSSFIRAAQDWGITSRRYTTPHDPAPLPTGFATEPTDDSTDPLPIPAIAWWWDPELRRPLTR